MPFWSSAKINARDKHRTNRTYTLSRRLKDRRSTQTESKTNEGSAEMQGNSDLYELRNLINQTYQEMKTYQLLTYQTQPR